MYELVQGIKALFVATLLVLIGYGLYVYAVGLELLVLASVATTTQTILFYVASALAGAIGALGLCIFLGYTFHKLDKLFKKGTTNERD